MFVFILGIIIGLTIGWYTTRPTWVDDFVAFAKIKIDRIRESNKTNKTTDS